MVGISNARAMPSRNMITKISSRVSPPPSERAPAQIAASVLAAWVTAITNAVAAIRHLPDENRERPSGTNCTSPRCQDRGIIGELVELPADRNHQHLKGAVGQVRAQPEHHE